MADYEYEVDLYGTYKADHSRYIIGEFLNELRAYPGERQPFELVSYDDPVYVEDGEPYHINYVGEFHAKLDIMAPTEQDALRKAKTKVRRYISYLACSPPKLEFT